MPPLDSAFAELLLSSHERLTGTALFPDSWVAYDEAAAWLYFEASFGLLAHDTADDPVFVYANRTAQRLFGYSWKEFIGLPSRLSTEPGMREEREAFIRSVTEKGYATGYRGLRIAKTGQRFWIEDVTMWDLTDKQGARHGQAALFRSWKDVLE